MAMVNYLTTSLTTSALRGGLCVGLPPLRGAGRVAATLALGQLGGGKAQVPWCHGPNPGAMDVGFTAVFRFEMWL